MTNSIGKRLTYSKLVTRAFDLIIARLPDYFAYRVFSRLCKKFDILAIAVKGDYGTIYGDPVDATIMGYYAQNKTWSNDIVIFIKDCFSDRPGTFLDIGANIGLITLPISFDANIMCKCFEPDPRNFEFLKRNIQENSRHGNIDVHNLAWSTEKTRWSSSCRRKTSVITEFVQAGTLSYRTSMTNSNAT